MQPTEQPASGFNFGRIMPLFLLTFVDVLGLTVLLPLLHLYAIAFNASPLQIGLVAAAFPLAQLIGVPVMGALSDRYGRKPLLLISQISTFISFVMLATANSLEMVILSRLVDGIFGANLATAQAAITDLTDEETRARGLGLTGAAFGLGFIIGPAISLIALEFTDSLATPALIAAGYSLLSIFITLFGFRESLPPEKRRAARPFAALFDGVTTLRYPQMPLLMILMFAQQVVFYGFETLLGLYALNRLGVLSQGNALIFLFVGFVLVLVQARLIGRWSQRYGERRLVLVAMGALALGLILLANAPQQPHPFYVERMVRNEITDLLPSATEAIIGDIQVPLPPQANRGVGGFLWFLLALVPIAVGAGLIRSGLNSLMTKRVGAGEYGAVLGLSASMVSLANAVAPLLGGVLFQSGGPALPFWVGGLMMALLLVISLMTLRESPR